MTTAKKVRPKRCWIRPCIAAVALGSIGLWWSWDDLVSSAVIRGLAAYQRGDWREADRLAQEHLRIAKHDPEAMRLLAQGVDPIGPLSQSSGDL